MIEKFLNDLLSQLGAGSREIVYLSVTPGVGLELIQIDPAIKTVKTYGCKPLEYSESKREIANYEDFKTALSELYAELGINPKCNVVLNLPMVHFGKIELPLLLNDEGVTEAIISEVEQSYIFKRYEPVVSWFDASNANSPSDSRMIFYSAVQKTVIDNIKEVLNELGSQLSSVDISMVASLRALLYSGIAEKQMTDGVSWNLMTINSNGYSIMSMVGKNIVDYYEEPLALKTYEMDEIYDAITASAQISLMNIPSNYLLILSDTDMVSAGLLAHKLEVDGQVDYLDNNSFKKSEILPVSLNILPDQVLKVSLEAIGVAATNICSYPIRFEFSGNKQVEGSGTAIDETVTFHFNGNEIVLTESVLKRISFIIAGILLVPTLTAMLTLPMMQKNSQAKLDAINSEISQIDGQIKQLSDEANTSGTFVVKTEIERVVKNNRAKLMSYSALGDAVPKSLWLTYFSTKDDGKIDIKGASENVEDIYLFFKNMKESLINTQLKLYKLEMMTNSIEDAVSASSAYEFEITNMSEAELNPAKPETAEKTEAKPANDKKNENKKDSKSLLNLKKKVNDLEPVDELNN